MPTLRAGVQEEDIDVPVEVHEDVCEQRLAQALTTSCRHLNQSCFYIGFGQDIHDQLERIDLIVASLQTCHLEELGYDLVYGVEIEGFINNPE